jgi:hypothetical protein
MKFRRRTRLLTATALGAGTTVALAACSQNGGVNCTGWCGPFPPATYEEGGNPGGGNQEGPYQPPPRFSMGDAQPGAADGAADASNDSDASPADASPFTDAPDDASDAADIPDAPVDSPDDATDAAGDGSREKQ